MTDSIARDTFNENAADVERLLTIHKELAGGTPGRKVGVSVLNKAAIVMIVTAWETYCKDAAMQSLKRMLHHAEHPDSLEKKVKVAVAEELRERKNLMLVWDLAGDGWRELATSLLQRHTEIGSPDAERVSKMMKNMIGLDSLTKTWYWPGMSVERAENKLADLIMLRGDIVHKGSAEDPVHKINVTDYLGHVQRLVEKTEDRITEYLEHGA